MPLSQDIRPATRVCVFLFSLVGSIGLASAQTGAEDATAVEPSTPSEQPAAKAPGSDITVRSQEALTALDRLRSEIEAGGESEEAAEQVELLRERVDELLPEGEGIEDLADNPALVDGVLVRSRALSTQSGTLIDSLTDSAEILESELIEIRQIVATWQRTRTEATDLPAALTERVDSILASAAELETLANEKLNRVVELQNASMAVRNLITPIAARIDSYDRSQQIRLLEQNAPPFWKITTEHISQSSERATRNFLGTLRRDFRSWRETSQEAIGGHFLLLPLLLFALFKLKGAAPETPSGALGRPVASGVLIWMLIGVVVYTGAPVAVKLVYVVIAMLVAGVVLVGFLPKNMRAGVIVFLGIALTEQLFSGLSAIDHLPRLAYLSATIALTALALVSLRRDNLSAFVDWGAPRSLVVGSVWVAAVLLSVSVLTNLIGYVHLAKLLTTGVIDSIAVFLVLFAGLTSVSEILAAVLSLPALDNVRSIAANRFRLKRVLRMPLVWLSLGLWLWATTRAFGIDGVLIGALSEIFLAKMSIGEVTLSLRGIFVFVLAVWLAVWTSRIVRAVLSQDVLPRMQLPRGIPNTISMTAHYSIMLIGLLLGVGFMGIDLSSFAFIVGALGVGIGFGLQNVVNNFVSGLILIFEAPIQIGDTVEVGALMGKVVQIGIRTSRVRTFSGSEVIVPNGDLVSNQVINWTLSDRRRRLELNVGVAYGSDPTRVTEILRGVLEADEDVLEDPAPIIVFSEFGDSALNFKMLAWVADYDMGFGMTHRLNTAINAALDQAGITIPFPQRDLHVKSLPAEATRPVAD